MCPSSLSHFIDLSFNEKLLKYKSFIVFLLKYKTIILKNVESPANDLKSSHLKDLTQYKF